MWTQTRRSSHHRLLGNTIYPLASTPACKPLMLRLFVVCASIAIATAQGPDSPEDCEAAGGTWIPERSFCLIPSPPAPPASPAVTEEECEESGGTWVTRGDRGYCLFSPPSPPQIVEHPGLVALVIAWIIGPSGPIGGPSICCMALTPSCIWCSSGLVGVVKYYLAMVGSYVLSVIGI